MKHIWGWIVAYLCRWLPHAVESGLLKIGNPDRNSPVIVTVNFSLTMKRVVRALNGQDMWVLLANSNGINVWCSAAGGTLTENRVIDAIKVSDLANKVVHRNLILPSLAASGINVKTIKEETGFRARFGPVYAEDIIVYIKAGQVKTQDMSRFDFGIRHRFDMAVSMNFPVWAVLALVLAIFWPYYLLGMTILFWYAIVFLCLFINWIPGRNGWVQAMLSAVVLVLVWGLFDGYRFGDPFKHWGWYIATVALFFAAGMDAAGILSGRKSDPEQLMHRLGIRSFGSFFSEKDLGEIHFERDKCTGCASCQNVCPVGVYSDPEEDKKISFVAPDKCFACSACVKQCPESALSLGD